MSFGKRVKQEREARGLTQSDLAKALGVSVPTIADYEADKKKPRPEKIVLLAKKLGVSTDYLLGVTDIKEPAHLIQRPKITDLQEYIMKKYPTYKGEPISEEKAAMWNKLFEKIFEVMDEMEESKDGKKKNGTDG